MPLLDTNHQRAALLVLLLGVALVIALTPYATGLIVGQAQEIAGGVIRNPLLGRLRELRLGGMDLGPRLADLGAQVVAWIGSSAFGLVGTATRLALNLTISLFGLFYLLLRPGETWE